MIQASTPTRSASSFSWRSGSFFTEGSESKLRSNGSSTSRRQIPLSEPFTIGLWFVGMKTTHEGVISREAGAYRPRAVIESPPVIALTAPSRNSLFSSGSFTYTNLAPRNRTKSSRAPPAPPPPPRASETKLDASAARAYPPNALRSTLSTVDFPLDPLPKGISITSSLGLPATA